MLLLHPWADSGAAGPGQWFSRVSQTTRPECPDLFIGEVDLLGQGPWAWAPGTALLVSCPVRDPTSPRIETPSWRFPSLIGVVTAASPSDSDPDQDPQRGASVSGRGGHGQGHLPPVTPDPWDRDPSVSWGWAWTGAPRPVTRDPSVSQRDGRGQGHLPRDSRPPGSRPFSSRGWVWTGARPVTPDPRIEILQPSRGLGLVWAVAFR